jgi:hypothetical protein
LIRRLIAAWVVTAQGLIFQIDIVEAGAEGRGAFVAEKERRMCSGY